ncbi:MAG: inositol-3-phosphate synthase [Thaumarchaeota archaeon]|nr:inositol-3-phosphate synthase [Nitrososphaerota archaeon]
MVVKVAIAGVGNCASIFVQGLEFYSRGSSKEGLWHPTISGLKASDIEIVAAFDIDSRKVGLDMADSLFASPNVARRYVRVPRSGVKVTPGLSKGEPPPHLAGLRQRTSSREDVSEALRKSEADLLLNLISSGTDASSRDYALAALKSGTSFVNCTPSSLVKDKSIPQRFKRAGLVIAGDDLMSQFGGTVFHKGLLNLMVKRGVKISKSYQLDVGGGSETYNTIDEDIKIAKRKIKTSSVSSEVPYKFETVAGTTDFVDYMGNERTSYFWVEGAGFLRSPVGIDVYLRSSDGANAGNVLLDVVRAVYAASHSKKYGAVSEICGYGFKAPPKPVHFQQAYSKFETAYL